MSVASLVRLGYAESVPSVVLLGFSTQGSAPQIIGGIGTLRLVKDRPEATFDLSRVFSGSGLTYSIAPAVEAEASFSTSTGVLTWNPLNAGDFGPYTVTAHNASGTADSDAFTVTVMTTAPAYGLYDFGLRFAIRIGL